MMKIWNKNTGPDLAKLVFYLKKIQDPCVHDFFFLKLIIRNIDIHTCLLDSTFLCPHLLNNIIKKKLLERAKVGNGSL